ncbi:hypothetical protein [Streptomyces sp. NPDC020681]|uniref:hypothetical protein n=1 Tax=Streptomyces sp. NPDC020681 TaxID=3365083 RepID=UPI00378D64CE
MWWLLAAVTAEPLLDGRGLQWSATAVRTATAELPGHVLLGAGTALLICRLGGLSRAVFSDDVRRNREARLTGGRVISLWHGVIAGLAGGIIFTGVLVAVGFLPTVASLVGSDSTAVGVVLHLLISQLIGITNALFFRRRSFDRPRVSAGEPRTASSGGSSATSRCFPCCSAPRSSGAPARWRCPSPR